MPFDAKVAREVLLPLAVHAYTEADIPRDCESLNTKVFKIVGQIVVDPDTCRAVWARLEEDARSADRPADAARASEMLTAVMADSHIFGFVAVKQKDVFVCFRGTHFLSDWLRNVDLPLVDFRFRADAGKAHMGFQAIYETIQASVLSLLTKAIPRVAKPSKSSKPSKTSKSSTTLTVVGHSLGGALTTICAFDEKVAEAAGGPPAHVCPIASPRVGDGDFRDVFNATLTDCFRIVNKPDIVPHAPLPIGYAHVGTAAVINSGFTLDLGFAHGLCEGYTRGLNRTIAEPAVEQPFD